MVAAGDEVSRRLGTLQDDGGRGFRLRERNRFVEQRLVADEVGGLDAAARRQDDLWTRIVDAHRKLARGETAEHDGMDGADARAGEHRDERLRHVRHVDDDAVALFRAKVGEDCREHPHFVEQLGIGDGAGHASDG